MLFLIPSVVDVHCSLMENSEERGVNFCKVDAVDQKRPDVGNLLACALSAILICLSWGRCLAYKGSYMADGSGVYGIPVPLFPPSIHNLQTYVKLQ